MDGAEHSFPSTGGFLCRFLVFVLCSVVAIGTATAGTRRSDDIVQMANGDVVTCEIRSLSQGALTIKQPYASSTTILDWRLVDAIASQQRFVVVDSLGHIFSGTLREQSGQHLLEIGPAAGTSITHESVVSIQETGETFLRSLRGDLDVGLDLAQSNSQQNLSVQGDLNYQASRQVLKFTANSQFTSQKKTTNTNETSAKTEYFARLRSTNFYGGVIANFLSSSEQEIALRQTYGGAIAVQPVLSNRFILSLIGGLGYTVESNASDSTSTTSGQSIDAAGAVQFSAFKFNATSFDSTVWIYPSLTSAGRVRMTINQDVYYKFYKDFYLRLSFYDNYDDRPVIGAPPNNLGASTSIGWSFR